MLRAKQIGTLSQCARTFYLSGSRCGSGDGAACTCSDDDTSVSGRQSSRANSLLKQHNLNPVSGAASYPASPALKEALGSVSHLCSEKCVYAVTSDSTSKSSSSVKTNTDRDDSSSASQASVLNKTSGVTAEHIVKAGIATAGVISELIHYRIPAATDGQEHLTPSNSVVKTGSPVYNTRPSNVKSSSNQSKYYKVQANSSSISTNEERSSSNSVFTQKNSEVKTSNTKKMNPKQNNPGTSAKAHRLSNTKEKYHPDTFVPHTRPGMKFSEKKVTAPASKFQYPARSALRFQSGGSLSSNRSANVRAVDLYYHALQQVKWGPKAEETLDNLHCKLDAFQANQVLKLLRDHTLALGFFKWLKHQPGFRHDEHTYTTMIGILGQARQFGIIRRLLDEMKREGCRPTVVTYNRLIHAYGRANYIHEAVEVFHQMQELGYDPDRVTYCTLIDIHAKAGYLEVALDLYRRMQEVGLSPDTFTYSAMVNCLGKAGHLAAAYNLFCEMIGQGCIPNLVTYNIMIALQAKARNYPSAVKLYRDMQGAGFRPDKITYSIVMEVLGHSGHLDEAEAVFLEMTRDWIPDEPVYGLLVDMWGKAGNVEKARSWFQSMLDAGLLPNVPTCNSLLSAFLKMQMFSDAHDVLENMIGMGLVPSLQTYTLLLSCCTETHQSHMRLCKELMAITGHPAHMFLQSLPNAEPGGQNVRDHASQFLELMHSEDRESKRGLLDAVIDFLHKSGLKEEAGFIWEVAAQRNVYPDSLREKSSSYWLINLHVMSEGTAITALSRTFAWFQRQILVSGCAPQRIDIITGWGRRSRVTGSSLVRQSVEELLHLFRFPFFTEHGNSGCFVACGEALNQWLLNSYVDRMHLL